MNLNQWMLISHRTFRSNRPGCRSRSRSRLVVMNISMLLGACWHIGFGYGSNPLGNAAFAQSDEELNMIYARLAAVEARLAALEGKQTNGKCNGAVTIQN